MPARQRILMRSGRRRRQAAMPRSRRFLIGGVIIVAALAYIIYGGMQEAMVYFVTPSELKAKESTSTDKFLRLGGMVVKGSLQKDLQNLTYRFQLTDGSATFPIFFKAKESTSTDKFLRLGGMVVKGSLQKDLQNLTYRFQLTDGTATFPIFFKGVTPDLFSECKGAVVEGRIGGDGVFQATTIMAKHAEEYSPHKDGGPPAKSFVP